VTGSGSKDYVLASRMGRMGRIFIDRKRTEPHEVKGASWLGDPRKRSGIHGDLPTWMHVL
jgi:hypothetical protein